MNPFTAINRGIKIRKQFKTKMFWDYLFKLFQFQHTTKIVETIEGFKFEVNTASDYLLIEEMMRDLYGKIKPNSIVVDIGAHKGVFTIRASIFAKEVHSFEPSEENFNILDRNLDLNRVTNVRGNMMAVAGKRGSVDLLLSKSALTNSIYHGIGKETGKTQRVVAITLDDIGREVPRIDFLKMDVEGAEYEIFYNTSSDTFNKIKKIVVELHPHDAYLNDDLVRWLEQRGFWVDKKEIGGYTHLFCEK